MAQFDVYINLNELNNKEIPYFLDVQHEILNNFSTKVVIPLALNEKVTNVVNPEILINNTKVIMLTTQIAGIRMDNIGAKVCSLEDKRDEIINAIDFLVTGF